MKRALKILAWLVGIPLLLVVLAVGGIAWLAGTDRGFNMVTAELGKRVPGLELGDIAGNLNTGIDGDAVSFENDAMRVDVTGLDSDWRSACLLKRAFCLDQLHVDEVRFAPKPVEAAPSTGGPIELPSISLPINVSITDLHIKRFVFDPPGDAPSHTVENIRLKAAASGDEITLDELALAYENYQAGVTGTLQLDGDYPLDLDLSLAADDVVETHDFTVELELDNTLRELDLRAQLGGAASALLTGRVEPLESDLPVNAQLRSEALGWPLDTNELVTATDVSVDVDGTLDDYLLHISTDVAGADVPDTTVTLSGRVNTERLLLPELIIDTLGGQIDGTASLDWTDGIEWLAAIGMGNINPGLQVQDLDGSLGGNIYAAGTVQDGNWTLELNNADITGVLKQYPFDLSAKASKGDGDILTIDELVLDNGDNQVRASGTLALVEHQQSDLVVNATLPQLQNLVPDLAGNVTADITLGGLLAEPDITLDVTAPVLSYQETAIQELQITADVKQAAIGQSNLSVTSGDIQTAGQSIRNLRLGAEGTRQEHTLDFFADGPEATALDITLAGGLSDSFDWLGELRSAVIDVPAHTLTLASPTALEWNQTDTLLGVDAHCWQTEDTNLCLQNKVFAAPSGSAQISLDSYPMSRLNPFLPSASTLEGALSLDTDIAWGPELPGGFQAEVQTRLQEGGFTVQDAYDEPVSFNYDTIELQASIDPGDVVATLGIASAGLGNAQVDVRIDPSIEAKAITGTVSLDGLDIGVAKAFVPDFDELSGTINASGDISGSLQDPRFDGNVILEEPVVRGEVLPLDIDGGQIDARVIGQRAEITGQIKAGEGEIDVSGDARWSGADWSADVALDGRDLNVVSDPILESNVNPKITIAARPDSIRLNGTINIPSATIDVAELPEGATTLSNDIVVIEDIEEEQREQQEEEAAQAKAANSDLDLRVNLDVILGDDIELDAYGLTANLTGDIGVAMRSPNPVQLAGEVQVVDGVFKKYGQDLEATGRVLFVGPVSATRLDIEAVREIDGEDRTAGLLIQGQVSEPEVSLFTNPSDKGDEAILSYIVLGRDIGETSDEEANLLATAALAIGVTGGKFVGERLANSLGIEEFDVESRGTGDDTEVVISGRINDRLVVKYGRNVFAPENSLYLRYDLTKQLYLEAVEGVQRAVDLFYEFSF